MSTTTKARPVTTPAGGQAAEDEAHDPTTVPERLRQDYDAAPNVGPDNYAAEMGTVRADGRPDYETWAHGRRMTYARNQARWRDREAARLARLRPCPCCGTDVELLLGARPGPGFPDAAVCSACRPVLADALHAAAPLPDGRTRAEAAREFAAALWAERRGEGSADA